MISKRFLLWQSTADVSKRAAAASALGRAYLECELEFDDRCGAEAAMTLLVDDPSPKVRMALADALASSPKAPAQIIAGFARDQFEIAAMVIARSPVLGDHDLEYLVPTASPRLQKVIARRPIISNRLARILVRYCDGDALVCLFDNINANLCNHCIEEMVTRHGGHSDLRGRLLAKPGLNVVLRYQLMLKANEALCTSPLMAFLATGAGGKNIVEDAHAKNLVHLLDLATADDYPELIEHLRRNDDLTTTLLLRAACFGKIDFLAHVFADMAGRDLAHVTAVLVETKRAPLMALLERAGMSAPVQPIIAEAVQLWKLVAQGQLDAGPQEVTYRLTQELSKSMADRRDAANDDIAALLRAIYLETMRENARDHALALAQAA